MDGETVGGGAVDGGGRALDGLRLRGGGLRTARTRRVDPGAGGLAKKLRRLGVSSGGEVATDNEEVDGLLKRRCGQRGSALDVEAGEAADGRRRRDFRQPHVPGSVKDEAADGIVP